MRKLLTACLVVALLSLAIYACGLHMTRKSIATIGKIKAVGVGIYWDSDRKENVTFIDWGIVEPNSTTHKTVYMQNEGNVDSALYLSTGNWIPLEAETFITLDWDYTGNLLEPEEMIGVDFILQIKNITDIASFSFDITVTTAG